MKTPCTQATADGSTCVGLPLCPAAASWFNGWVSESPRRVVIEKPDEKQDRTGCLAVGAILGIVVGIMVGMYALPPILKDIYGESTVEANTTFEGDGRSKPVLVDFNRSDHLPDELETRRPDVPRVPHVLVAALNHAQVAGGREEEDPRHHR